MEAGWKTLCLMKCGLAILANRKLLSFDLQVIRCPLSGMPVGSYNDRSWAHNCLAQPVRQRQLSLTKSPFSQPIGRDKTCYSFALHFPNVYDCFRGSDKGVPMAGVLWGADLPHTGAGQFARSVANTFLGSLRATKPCHFPLASLALTFLPYASGESGCFARCLLMLQN